MNMKTGRSVKETALFFSDESNLKITGWLRSEATEGVSGKSFPVPPSGLSRKGLGVNIRKEFGQKLLLAKLLFYFRKTSK